jgi:beta-glucosidase
LVSTSNCINFHAVFDLQIMMNIFKTPYHPASYGWKENQSDEELDTVSAEIVRKMTLDEKIRLMGEQNQLSRIKIGLGLLFKFPIPFKAGGNKRFRVPPILFTDGPRGVTFSGGKSTTFPVSMARGASWDVELERRIGDAIGKESRAVDSNYSGSVCMNILRHPAWGRAQETYGEDSWHVGEMAAALVDGVQQHNVLACIKHFAANNIENSRYMVSANMDERTLREVYLPHFKKCIDRGAMTVMSAYNRLDGEYCGHNKYLLTDILRNEWKFKGNVTSDWDNGIYDTVKPIKAGMNVEMSYARYLTYKKVKQALKEGLVTEDDISQSGISDYPYANLAGFKKRYTRI